MTPTQSSTGSTMRFGCSLDRRRGVVPRQATLEASITWSHDLLSEQEKALLRRLSVFVGGCTLAAAEAVCSDDEIVRALTVLDLLDRLVTSPSSYSTMHRTRPDTGSSRPSASTPPAASTRQARRQRSEIATSPTTSRCASRCARRSRPGSRVLPSRDGRCGGSPTTSWPRSTTPPTSVGGPTTRSSWHGPLMCSSKATLMGLSRCSTVSQATTLSIEVSRPRSRGTSSPTCSRGVT